MQIWIKYSKGHDKNPLFRNKKCKFAKKLLTILEKFVRFSRFWKINFILKQLYIYTGWATGNFTSVEPKTI